MNKRLRDESADRTDSQVSKEMNASSLISKGWNERGDVVVKVPQECLCQQACQLCNRDFNADLLGHMTEA